jgi:hypothetical protein
MRMRNEKEGNERERERERERGGPYQLILMVQFIDGVE